MTDAQLAVLIWAAPFILIGLIFAIGHTIAHRKEGPR